MTEATRPDALNWVLFSVAVLYVLAIFLSVSLGDHRRGFREVIHRQLYGLLVTAVGVILPAAIIGIYTRSGLIGFAVIPMAAIPLIALFRWRRAKYEHWVSDQEFKRKYTEEDNSPVINRRPLC